jgi:hypothetical protein
MALSLAQVSSVGDSIDGALCGFQISMVDLTVKLDRIHLSAKSHETFNIRGASFAYWRIEARLSQVMNSSPIECVDDQRC